MSTKYYCDGCDMEVGERRLFIFLFEEWQDYTKKSFDRGPLMAEKMAAEYRHLCIGCESTFRNRADPKLWPRPVSVGDKAA